MGRCLENVLGKFRECGPRLALILRRNCDFQKKLKKNLGNTYAELESQVEAKKTLGRNST